MPTMCAATRVCTVPDGRSSSSCRAGGGGAELGGAPPTPRRRNAASAVRNPRGAATAANTRINTPANGTVNRAYPATVNTPNAPSATTSTHHRWRAPMVRRMTVRVNLTTVGRVPSRRPGHAGSPRPPRRRRARKTRRPRPRRK